MPIEWDAGCRNPDGSMKEWCICGEPGVATDSLMMSDETRDGDEDWNFSDNCPTATTVCIEEMSI